LLSSAISSLVNVLVPIFLIFIMISF
jgi:hypothetical protein